MLLGGAVFNAVNLALGGDYAGFADQAHFGWVTTAWRAVVAPNQLLFIGLLVAFEAVVGVLILSPWTEDPTRAGWSDRVPRRPLFVRLGRHHIFRSDDCCAGVVAPRETQFFTTDAPAALDSRGQTRPNPSEVAVPAIGDEVPAARALRRLADRLLGVASDDIKAIGSHEVHLRP